MKPVSAPASSAALIHFISFQFCRQNFAFQNVQDVVWDSAVNGVGDGKRNKEGQRSRVGQRDLGTQQEQRLNSGSDILANMFIYSPEKNKDSEARWVVRKGSGVVGEHHPRKTRIQTHIVIVRRRPDVDADDDDDDVEQFEQFHFKNLRRLARDCHKSKRHYPACSRFGSIPYPASQPVSQLF